MRWFWGIIIVTIGIAFLGLNFGWWDARALDNLFSFWPLIIVLLGLALIFSRWHWGWIPVLLIMAGLIAGAFYMMKTGQIKILEASKKISSFGSDLPANITNARIEVNAGASNIFVKNGTKLVDGTLESSWMEPDQTVKIEGDTAIVRIDTRSNLRIGHGENKLDLNITDKIPVDLFINAGASNINLDLSSIKIKSLTLKAGASSINGSFGALENNAKINFDAGASKINLKFNPNIGVNITNQSGLVQKNFEGFVQTGEHNWQSANYAVAPIKCDLNFNAGASTIDVRFASS